MEKKKKKKELEKDPQKLRHNGSHTSLPIIEHPRSAVRNTVGGNSSSGSALPTETQGLATTLFEDDGSATTRPQDTMADPFEVRMRFTTQLQHLSASTTSSLKCAHYALKHRDQDEDLHSCIIEQLERNNMNNRANIMYFLEHLCDLAGRPTKDGHEMYVKMIERDIERIIDAVAPKDGSGAANVKVVRTVLTGLKGRGVLGEDKMESLEEGLKGRDTRPEHLLGEDVMADDVMDDVEGPQQQIATTDGGGAQQQESVGAAKTATADTDLSGITPQQPGLQQQTTGGGDKSTQQPGSKFSGIIKVDKRVIEQRIEEDRERNKRLRESVWAVGSTDREELDRLWEETSDLGIDDYIKYGEEAAEREQAAHYASLE